MNNRMNVLMISPDLNYPPIYGGRIRRYNLLKYLSKDNDITLLSFINSKEDLKNIEGIKGYCEAVETVRLGSNLRKDYLIAKLRNYFLSRFFSYPPIVLHFYSREMKRRIKKLLAENDYDLVLIEYWYMGQYAEICGNIPKVLDEVDVEYIRRKRMYQVEKDPVKKSEFYSEWIRTKKYELKFIKKFDRIIAVTPKDKQILEREIPSLNISIIPTCIDSDYIKPSEIPNNLKDLIFVGSYGHYPNVDGVLYFCRDIFPRILKEVPETHLYIVGPYATKKILNLASKNITVTGLVKDIRPYISRSVSIVPLRVGSGIKGKIIEAMGLGSPVITTSIGAEGLKIIRGKHLLIEDMPEGFAKQTIELLKNKLLRERLRENGLKLVREKYTWDKVISELNTIFEEMVMSKK